MNNTSFFSALKMIVGEIYVKDDPKDMQSFLVDYRRRFVGKASAIVLPANTTEVAKIVKLCNDCHVSIVPQGGNTGLVLGSIPDNSGKSIVLSLIRMNAIREIDIKNNTMTVQAGCILDHIHQAAEKVGRLFPLSLASSGSCTIGGNLATNAGGTAVLRYGTARDLCLGLEVVTPNGEIWDGLYKLRKNNTGYDLRNLYVGSEGTLGIITAAVIRLFARPLGHQTMLCSVTSPEKALDLLHLMQALSADALSTFELISQYSLSLVHKHFPELSLPLPLTSPYYVFMELSTAVPDENVSLAYSCLEQAFTQNLIEDAAIAQDINQAKNMWALRENISAAQSKQTKNIKHDIAVPVSCFAEFIEKTDALLEQHFPGCRIVTFGHLGDGSLHYNVGAPDHVSADDFLKLQEKVNRVVYDSVNAFGGVISAEHGIGALKHISNASYKSPIENTLMKTIKNALDPNNIMNPGKVLA